MTESSGSGVHATLRWGLSLLAVLVVHLGGAAALLAWRIPQDPPASLPAVMIDMAPAATAPSPDVSEAPPGPKQEISEPPPPEVPAIETAALARDLPEPPPREPVEVPKEPDRLAEMLPMPETPPEVAIEVPVPPKPAPPKKEPPPAKPKPVAKPAPRKPEPQRKPPARQTTAPAAAPTPPQQAAAAPPPGTARQPSPDAVRRWQSTLVAHLQRHKRYPGSARRDNEEGVVYLRFTMDRHGAVLARRIERASGHRALDQETLELIERAQPLPAPPADMPGQRFEFVVPVQFQLR